MGEYKLYLARILSKIDDISMNVLCFKFVNRAQIYYKKNVNAKSKEDKMITNALLSL